MKNFTENEMKAIKAIYADCLDSMGGKNLDGLLDDQYTWASVRVLTDAGWSKHEAAGTFGTLMEKEAIYSTGETDNPYTTHVLSLSPEMIEVLRQIDKENGADKEYDYYILKMEGCVESVLIGPFSDEETRNDKYSDLIDDPAFCQDSFSCLKVTKGAEIEF